MEDDASNQRSGEVTALLRALADGDTAAEDRLVPLVYDELRSLARGLLSRERHRGLQTTALVHEAYIRLGGRRGFSFENRAHLFGAAARAMRRILVEQARRRQTARELPPERMTPLDDCPWLAAPAIGVLDLDRALAQQSNCSSSGKKWAFMSPRQGYTPRRS